MTQDEMRELLRSRGYELAPSFSTAELFEFSMGFDKTTIRVLMAECELEVRALDPHGVELWAAQLSNPPLPLATAVLEAAESMAESEDDR